MKIARTFPVEVVVPELVDVVVPELVDVVVPELVDVVVPELVDVLELQWFRRAPMTLTRSPAAGGFAP
jgi:hypothetical protein